MGNNFSTENDILSEKLFTKIKDFIEENLLERDQYQKNADIWLKEEVLLEEKVIKLAEAISGKNFKKISSKPRVNIAFKSGLDDFNTQLHLDKDVFANIVIPIILKDLKESGLTLIPPMQSFLVKPLLKFKFISNIILRYKIIRVILRTKYIKYFHNKGYGFRGFKLVHGVTYKPLSEKSIRAVLTINFKK